MKWVVILGVILFFGFLAYTSIGTVQSQCEVCLDFEGRVVCRSGAGATEEAALKAAQESACGGNASGMSESIACLGATPVSTQCSTT